jgi:PAS domain S-box-containing protein
MADVLGSIASKIAFGIERYRANESLREREEHIRLLLDSAAEGIYGIDLEGRCTFANSTCLRLLGYENINELLGRNMHSLIHHTRPDGTPYPISECKIYQAFHRQRGVHVDDEALWRADGSSFPAEYWSYPICRNAAVAGSVVTFLDIAERRQLEARFYKAQERLREVVVSSPAVLFTLSIDHGKLQVSWISDNLLEVMGYPPQDAVGTDWWLINIHPGDREKTPEQTREAVFGRGQSSQEYRFRHADGSYRWIKSDIRLLHDEAGCSTRLKKDGGTGV